MDEKEATTTTTTTGNARKVFMDAAKAYIGSRGRENKRNALLKILQNNDSNTRAVLATCVNEHDAILACAVAGSIRDFDLLQAFHDLGMNVDVKDDHDIRSDDGFTPLTHASMNGRTPVVELLLEKNANPDLQNKYGMTALMYASSNGHKEIVQLLLDHNADIELKNKYGKTALDLAKNRKIKGMLKKHVNNNNSYVLK